MITRDSLVTLLSSGEVDLVYDIVIRNINEKPVQDFALVWHCTLCHFQPSPKEIKIFTKLTNFLILMEIIDEKYNTLI